MALLPVGRPRRLLLTAGVVIIVEHSALVQRLPRGRDSKQRRAEWFENRPQCPATGNVPARWLAKPPWGFLLAPIRYRENPSSKFVSDAPPPAMSNRQKQPDLAGPSFKANPFPYFAHLREVSPVHEVRLGLRRTAWLIARYDDALAVLRD